jgi:hypothetical protein
MSDIVRDHRGRIQTVGIKPLDSGAVNKGPAAADTMVRLGAAINQLLTKRLKVHAGYWTDVGNGNDPDIAFRVLFHTTPNTRASSALGVSYVRARLVLTASRYDAATEPDPTLSFATVDVTGARASSASPPDIHHGLRDENVGPQNLRTVDVDIPLVTGQPSGDRTYELRITQTDLCQIVSLSLYELPHEPDPAYGDLFVTLSKFRVGGPIYDADVAVIWEALQTVYDRHGSVLFAWAPAASTRARTITQDLFLVNIFDAAETAYGADTYGFWCAPIYHGTIDEDTFGVVLWVAFDAQIADVGGHVDFAWVAGTIGSIDIQPYNAAGTIVYATLQTRWVGGGALSPLKIDVLAQVGVSGNSLVIYACGAYEKEPTDPRSIPDLAVWLDADRLNGLSDGDPVATWPDSSGNGNDFAQATSGFRPVYKTGIVCGKPVVRFDGVDDYLHAADSATYKGASLTVFAVYRRAGANADNIVVCYPHDVTHTSPFFRWAIDAKAASHDLAIGADVGVSSYGAPTDIWRVWTYDNDGAVFSRDGVAVALTGTSGGTISYPNAVGLYLGADVAGGENFDGDIAEIIIYKRQLSTRERQTIEEYLSEKYGLQRGPT